MARGDCAVRGCWPPRPTAAREPRLVEHLDKRRCCTTAHRPDRLTWIRAADHSRESARFVAGRAHFFDARKRPLPEDQKHPNQSLEIIDEHQ